MSALSIDPTSGATAVPDVDWEGPPYPPPPLPPEAPPLPILEQTPVKACFFDLERNMHARPPISLADMEEEAEAKFGVLEDMARESRFGASLAHLPHSKVDWSTSTEAMAAGALCWIPEAGCGGFAPGVLITDDIVRDHFRSRVHKNHEEAMRLEAENKEPSPPPPEPRFVMFRTMNIVFLDPPGDPDRVIPDS
ncbi:Ff.00g128510.m01.CDS01 [Fusarium sp. VM40]|nr:Ff.00g128510.m01.CDS01 [Fusarium sp. VM40]